MNAQSPFTHLQLQPVATTPKIGDQSTLLNEVLINVDGLADSATLFFRGVFPHESPHFPWGTHKLLPWFGQYEISPDALERAICDASKRVLDNRSVMERGPTIGEGYERDFDTGLNVIQLLAVEALLAIEGLIASIETQSLASALSWQFAAFANISEASLQAMKILNESNERTCVH